MRNLSRYILSLVTGFVVTAGTHPTAWAQPFLKEGLELSVDTEFDAEFDQQQIQVWHETDSTSIVVATEFEDIGDTSRAVLSAWIDGRVVTLDDGFSVPFSWVGVAPVAEGFIVLWNDQRSDAPGVWMTRLSPEGDQLDPPSLFLERGVAERIYFIDQPEHTLVLLSYSVPGETPLQTCTLNLRDDGSGDPEVSVLAAGTPSPLWSWRMADGRIVQGIGSTLFVIESSGEAHELYLPGEVFNSRRYFIGDSMVVYVFDHQLIALDILKSDPELWRVDLPEEIDLPYVGVGFDSVGLFVQSVEGDTRHGVYVGCFRAMRWHLDLAGTPIDQPHLGENGCRINSGQARSSYVTITMSFLPEVRRNDNSLQISISALLYTMAYPLDPIKGSWEGTIRFSGRPEDNRTLVYSRPSTPIRVRENGESILYYPYTKGGELLRLQGPPTSTEHQKRLPSLGLVGTPVVGWNLDHTGEALVQTGSLVPDEVSLTSEILRTRLTRQDDTLYTSRGWLESYREITYGDRSRGWRVSLTTLYGGKTVSTTLASGELKDGLYLESIARLIPIAFSCMPGTLHSTVAARIIDSSAELSDINLYLLDQNMRVSFLRTLTVAHRSDRIDLLSLGKRRVGLVVNGAVVYYVNADSTYVQVDTLPVYPGYIVVAKAVLHDSSWVRLLTHGGFNESVVERYSQEGELLRTRGFNRTFRGRSAIVPHEGGRVVAIIEEGHNDITATLLGPNLETISVGGYNSLGRLMVANEVPLRGPVLGRWKADTLVIAWQGNDGRGIEVIRGNVMTLAEYLEVVENGPDLPEGLPQRLEEFRIINYDYWQQYRSGDPDVIRQLSAEERQSAFGYAIHGVTPNPAYGDITLQIGADYSLGAYIEIVDVTGRTLYRSVLAISPGMRYYRVPDEFGESGVYVVRVTSPDFSDQIRVIYLGR